MKYVLVDNRDNINTSVELGSNVGISGARTYFMGIKKLDPKEFDKLWKVMIEDEYVVKQAKKPIKWWIEDKEITDSELKF